MQKLIFYLLTIFLLIAPNVFAADNNAILSGEYIQLEYDKSNTVLANKIFSMYKPSLELVEKQLGLDFKQNVYIKLSKDKASFQEITGIKNVAVQGIAVSQNNLIIISAENIFYKSQDDIKHLLEHELAHLVLGNNIGHEADTHFPRWLNEGLAQFVSNGSNELFSYAYQDSLQTAFITGRIIPFSNLIYSFPGTQNEFTQSYAQSLSFLEYLSQTRGKDKLLLLIQNLKGKNDFYQSFEKTYGIAFQLEEQNWKQNKKKANYTLDYYISTHINSIIDGFVGIVAILVFIISYFKNKRKKLNQFDEIEQE